MRPNQDDDIRCPVHGNEMVRLPTYDESNPLAKVTKRVAYWTWRCPACDEARYGPWQGSDAMSDKEAKELKG